MANVVADEGFTLRDETLVIGVDVDALIIPVVPRGVTGRSELEVNAPLLDVIRALFRFEGNMKSESLAPVPGLSLSWTLLMFCWGRPRGIS